LIILLDETPHPDFEVAWEGLLDYEDPAEVDSRGSTLLPTAQIGKPAWWSDQ